MNCPRCKSKNVQIFEHEAVEFDFCCDCRGIWCDRGELSQYVETINDIPNSNSSKESAKETELKCPKCIDSFLVEIPYLKGKELLIDTCNQCNGIWLDFKELASIQKLARNVDARGKLERTINHMKKPRL